MSATPGPWRHVTCQRPNGGKPWETVEDSDGNLLGEFYGDEECNAANARLAAAAPETLAALHEITRMIGEAEKAPETIDRWLDRIDELACAVIATAEGAE